MEVRSIPADGVEGVADTIALAFRGDPVWGPALEAADGSLDHLQPYWRVYVEAAQRYDGVFASVESGAASVWIPPGATELSPEQEDSLRELAERVLTPDRAEALFELWQRFDDHHPHDAPHAYLSLLARDPRLAGHGIGQQHLTAVLERWDAAGIATYLESTNPGNDHRYQRHGYVKVGGFESVLDGAVVATMWRPVGG